MIILRNLKLPLKHELKDVEKKILKTLKISHKDLLSYEIVKKAIDSRKKDNIHYIYNININVNDERKLLKFKNVDIAKEYKYKVDKVENFKNRPVIIGTGPAGLLAGIVLAEAGLKPILIEQGKDVDSRKKDIEKFWETGQISETSNVQFGAGGAGTFSDGKLTTGVNNERKYKLMDELIKAGAHEDIKYLSKPHLGTDVLEIIVKNMCKKIEDLGGKILFETKFIGFVSNENKLQSIKVQSTQETYSIKTDYMILAIGHSSRETFENMYNQGVYMKAKPFAVGVRIEHLQKDVNISQYGSCATMLDAASYKLNTRFDERTMHTFCMCPGGVVVGAASEKDSVVTNGMSYYKRDLINSNSALLVNIKTEDFQGEENPLNGIYFQRKLEKIAFKAGGENYFAPAQKVGDFLNNQKSESFTKVKPTYLPGVRSVNLNEEFPEFIVQTLKQGIIKLRDKVDFLKDDEAVITAIESRSSSPVTIIRDENFMSNINGILPCGEGAGYAGGIVSAAIDGIKCAEQIIKEIQKDIKL